MKVLELPLRDPAVIDCGATIHDAATTMLSEGLGALIVTDHDRPVGVVTDRDIVTRGVATGMASDGRIDGVMSMGVIALDSDADVEDLFELLANHAVRRVPIVERDRVVGVVTLDDAMVATAQHVSAISGVLTAQMLFPHAGDEAPAPAIAS